MSRNDVTLSIAVLGAFLGIVNTAFVLYKARRDHQVRLRVNPKLARIESALLLSSDTALWFDGFLAVEVVNDSVFPVTLSELSVLVSVGGGTPGRGHSSVQVLDPSTTDGRKWPIKLDRHEAVVLCAEHLTGRQLLRVGAKSVTVKSSNGTIAKGTSPVIKLINEHYRIALKDDLGIAHTEQ